MRDKGANAVYRWAHEVRRKSEQYPSEPRGANGSYGREANMLIDRGIVSEGVIFCRSPASRIRRTTTTGGYIIGPHAYEADPSERDGRRGALSLLLFLYGSNQYSSLVKRSQKGAYTLIH